MCVCVCVRMSVRESERERVIVFVCVCVCECESVPRKWLFKCSFDVFASLMYIINTIQHHLVCLCVCVWSLSPSLFQSLSVCPTLSLVGLRIRLQKLFCRHDPTANRHIESETN